MTECGEQSDDDSFPQKSESKRRLTLHYPRHLLRPEDLLTFVELPPFTKRWKALGLDDEDDLTALQLGIMAEPKKSRVIRGTDGIRKLRFVPKR